MNGIEVNPGPPRSLGVDFVALPVWEPAAPEVDGAPRTLQEWSGGAFSRLVARGAFRGKRGEVQPLLSASPDRPDLLAVGLGTAGEPQNAIRDAAGVASRCARGLRARSLAFVVPRAGGSGAEGWQEAAEGILLGDWECDELRRPEDRCPEALERRVLLADGEQAPGSEERAAAARGAVLAEAQNRARDLVALPGNVVTPRYLAGVAEELGDRHGLRVESWGPEQLRRERFGALLAVARGSAEEPRFILVEHAGGGGAPYCVVGKGVTFDSGGISIKPASGMEAMKYDMAGAAAVFGLLEAAARLELPQRIIGLVPATENLPSGSALKPADVIRGVSGTSIEVINTDAEGRLILSDALSYAARLSPRAIVDLATLTGGCVVALGRHAVGLMTPDDGLARELETAGARTGERLWRLPLWEAYGKQLKSDVADLKNSGGREGSPITAGFFLKRFVGEVPWAHLDIAGTAWVDEASGCQPKGATGIGVRLLVEWLRSTA
ncbi:MAG: leucyl aminopeptidase [Gemmatimonadota bacterium]